MEREIACGSKGRTFREGDHGAVLETCQDARIRVERKGLRGHGDDS